MANAHHEITERRWLTLEAAAIYSGIGARTLQSRIKDGAIRSSNCCAPGASRGRRLIDRESLDSFIESGVGAPPTALAMNANRAQLARV